MISVKAESRVRRAPLPGFYSDLETLICTPDKRPEGEQDGYSDESTRAGALLVEWRLVVRQHQKCHMLYSDGADEKFIRDCNLCVDPSPVNVSHLPRRGAYP